MSSRKLRKWWRECVEDETEDGVESGFAIEPAITSARYFRSDSVAIDSSVFIFRIHGRSKIVTNRKVKNSTRARQKIKSKRRARRSPTRGRKIRLLVFLRFHKVHAWFHSRRKRMLFRKPAWFRELPRNTDRWNWGFAVVLVPKFLLAPARFVGKAIRGRSGGTVPPSGTVRFCLLTGKTHRRRPALRNPNPQLSR